MPTAEPPHSIWRTILNKIAERFAGEIVFPLVGLLLLLAIGFPNSPEVLKFVNSTFKKWLKPANVDLWIARRTGTLFLKRARLALKKNDLKKALPPFANAVNVLQSALTEANVRQVDSSRIQNLLNERDLAPLYSLQAWSDVRDQDNKLKAAIDSADQALRLDPDLVDARIARGWGKLLRNVSSDLSEAESDFLAVIQVGQERETRFTWAQFGYAETLRLQGDYDRAINAYSPLFLDDPKLPGVLAGRGAAYHSSGNWRMAIDDLTEAIVLEPNHPWALVLRADALRILGRLDEAIEDCKRIIEREPGNQSAHYIYGLTLYQQSQVQPSPPASKKRDLLEAAGKQFRAAKEIAAGRAVADILYKLAAVESELGNKDQSQRWLDEARNTSASSGIRTEARVRDVLTLWPTLRDLFETRTADDVAKTLDEARELIKEKPNDAGARYSAGLLHLIVTEDATDPQVRSDNLGEAIRQFDLSIKSAPTWAAPYYSRAWAHTRGGDLTEARKDCDLVIAMDSNNSDAYWLRAKIRNAIDYRDQASDDAATALRLVNDEIDRGERAAARYVLRSELRLQQGELEGAVQDAEMAMSLNETNASACVVLSQALMKLGRFERALYEAERAAKLNPAKSDAHMARGLGYYYTGKPQEAIQAFSRAIELMPRESFAYLDRGWGRLLLWEKTKGPADLRLADEDFATATNAAKSAASAYGGQAWVRYWQHREGAGTLDEAIRFSRLALERDANLGFTHFVRGWIMLAKGQFAEAKTEFSTAIELGSSGPDAHYGLADAERMLGNQDAAVKTYTRAVEKATEAGTDVWHMYYGRALAYAASRNWASAFDDYRATLENAKKSSVTPSQYAGVYADFGWACYELRRDVEMESVFARALELDGKLIHLQLQMAGVRLYSGRYDDALACWNSAISVDPKSSVAYVNRGLTHIYRQDFAAALSDLETALSLDGKDSFAWHNRGWAWLRQGEWKRAVADTDKAIELRSSNEPFRFNNRALARWWLRERSGAVGDIRKVLEILLSRQTGRFPARVREDEVTWGATSKDWAGAVARRPRDFLPHLGRGISRWMAGDLKGARDDLTEARSINARSREVEMVLERVMEELAARLSVA